MESDSVHSAMTPSLTRVGLLWAALNRMVSLLAVVRLLAKGLLGFLAPRQTKRTLHSSSLHPLWAATQFLMLKGS